MSLQTSIRDRARGLRGPGLSTEDRDYFDEQVAAVEEAADAVSESLDLTLLTVDSTGARILSIPPGTLDENNVFVSGVDENGPIVASAPAIPEDANAVQVLNHLVGHGQSLSRGQEGAPPIDVTALDPDRGLMLGAYIDANDNTTAYVVPASRISGFTDLTGPGRSGNEHPMIRAVHGLLPVLPDDNAVLATGHGVSGEAIAALNKGTQPWANMLYTMRQAKRLASVRGLEYRVLALDWIQGENDYGRTKDAYLSDLVDLQADFEADARAISGQTGDIPVFLDQCASWTKYSDIPYDPIAEAQLQAALTYPDKFICVCPKYFLPYADGIHLTATGYWLLGQYHGRALAAVAAGGSYAPMHVVSAIRSGTTLTLTCDRNVVADTTLVTDPGQRGVVYRDGSNNLVALTYVGVSGATITYTLASGVAGTVRIALEGTAGNNAGPTTGPRACFRDASADMAADGTTHLYNWISAQALAVA